MPSQEAIAQTVNRYLELVAAGKTDEILTLYAADATIEDPIGSDVLRGHDDIRGFYAGFQDLEKETELAELKVGGSEAAYLWHLTLITGDSRSRISPISHMTFDEDAKILSMRAFWSPSDVKVL
ncbi:steroid delta-isomerase [Mycobacterium interjectum]|nr:steroid delta-isomerase [Mycobacterium interjectum]